MVSGTAHWVESEQAGDWQDLIRGPNKTRSAIRFNGLVTQKYYLSFWVLPNEKRVSSNTLQHINDKHLLAHVNRPEASPAPEVHDSRTMSYLWNQSRRV